MPTGDTNAALYHEGARGWEGIIAPEDGFAAYASGRIAALGPDCPPDAAELYIAWACATGSRPALDAFEQRYFSGVRPALRRMKLGPDDADEVLQTLRIRLFLSEGDRPPHILSYAGAGTLHGLVRVAATRAALSLLRTWRTASPVDPIESPTSPWPSSAIDRRADGGPRAAVDPGTALARETYRAELKQAFEDAARGLETRDRALLRLHFLDRLSIDDIAALYRVHRATAARWLVAARERLIADSRVRFADLTGLARGELATLQDLVESQLSLSLDRVLRSTIGGAEAPPVATPVTTD